MRISAPRRAPTASELLDWLATEFMRERLEHEEDSEADGDVGYLPAEFNTCPELTARDPYNQLYARGPRFRVEAEMVHDMTLR